MEKKPTKIQALKKEIYDLKSINNKMSLEKAELQGRVYSLNHALEKSLGVNKTLLLDTIRIGKRVY